MCGLWADNVAKAMWRCFRDRIGSGWNAHVDLKFKGKYECINKWSYG